MFQKIKALLALNKAFQNIKEAVKMSNHNYFSTEFLAKIVFQLILVLGTLKGFIPSNVAAIIGASLTAIYIVCRTIYKTKNAGQDLPEPPAV